MWGERKKVVFLQRRVGRVVDRGGLENRWPSRVRGFESLTLRSPSIKGVKHGFTPFWLEGHSATACCRKNGLIIKSKPCAAGLWLMGCRAARGGGRDIQSLVGIVPHRAMPWCTGKGWNVRFRRIVVWHWYWWQTNRVSICTTTMAAILVEKKDPKCLNNLI